MAFQSAASSLVDETRHPVDQLEILEKKVLEFHGDTDAVIECRIKQLALQRLLCHLYEFPLQGLMRAEITLAEAYADGGYFKQADEHLTRAREMSGGAIHDDGQCSRMQADIFIAEGAMHLARARQKNGSPRTGAPERGRECLDAAKRSLDEAYRLTREAYGKDDVRCARIFGMKAQRARHLGNDEDAIGYSMDAWEVWDCAKGPTSIEALRAKLKVAEAEHRFGKDEDACRNQQHVIDKIRQIPGFDNETVKPGSSVEVFFWMLVEAAMQLSQWLQKGDEGADSENSKQDLERALNLLKEAQEVVNRIIGGHGIATCNFQYTWVQHCRQSLFEVLEERIPRNEWMQNVGIVGQHGNRIPITDYEGNLMDLQDMCEDDFPVTVNLEENGDKEQKKARIKAVDIKREIALLYLKMGDNDNALQSLNDVHYFERCLHGSRSNSVARTLKALGTVHMVKEDFSAAAECLYQALRIFENEPPTKANAAIIKDIHAKLRSIR